MYLEINPRRAITDADISGSAAISSTKISFVADSVSGNAVDGGTISNFASTGIDDNATSLAMTVSTAGNVGIGTANPSTSLEIRGPWGAPASSGTTQTGALRVANSSTFGNVLDLGGYSTSPYGLWLQATDRGNLGVTYPVVMQPNGGNVGIGTTSPGQKLSVAGVIESTSGGIKFPDGTTLATATVSPNWASPGAIGSTTPNTGAFTTLTTTGNATTTANIGIGTASPTQMLHLAKTGTSSAIRFQADSITSSELPGNSLKFPTAASGTSWTIRPISARMILHMPPTRFLLRPHPLT